MKINLLKTIKISLSFALGVVFVFTAVFSYYDALKYTYELTFLSNLLTGLFLLVAGILQLCKKPAPQFLFLDFTVLLLIVFGVCMAFVSEFNFDGSFAFLHIVNPLLMLAFYLILTDQTKVKMQFLFTALTLPFAYLVFALIFGAATGNYIYFFLDYKTHGAGYTVMFVLGILIGLIAVGIILYFINRLIHRHILKNV